MKKHLYSLIFVMSTLVVFLIAALLKIGYYYGNKEGFNSCADIAVIYEDIFVCTNCHEHATMVTEYNNNRQYRIKCDNCKSKTDLYDHAEDCIKDWLSK